MVVLTPTESLCLDCEVLSVREINDVLRSLPDGAAVDIVNPRGRHNLAVGLATSLEITIHGNSGYFVGGLGGRRGGGPAVTVDGFVGWSVAENLMGGSVRVRGSASQSVGASARGGTIVIEGDASLRAGISLKGADIAIAGDVGAMSGFMAQAGTILVGGDAGHGLGDSLYEATIYVGGDIASLGADAQIVDIDQDDVDRIRRLIDRAGFTHINAEDVTRVSSARRLYHFASLNQSAYR